jgi:hypothetical protein
MGKELGQKYPIIGLVLAEIIVIPWVLLKFVIEIPLLDDLLRLLLGLIWMMIPMAIFYGSQSLPEGRQRQFNKRLGGFMLLGSWCMFILFSLNVLWVKTTYAPGQIVYWIEPKPGQVYKVSDIPRRGPMIGAYGCRMVERHERLFPGLLYARGNIHQQECYETWFDEEMPPRLTQTP